jgi:hypothetical protein
VITENTRVLGENSLPKTELLGELREDFRRHARLATQFAICSPLTERELSEHEASNTRSARQAMAIRSWRILGLLLITEKGRETYDSFDSAVE